MARCDRILADGSRCPEMALIGRPHCQSHGRRVTFRLAEDTPRSTHADETAHAWNLGATPEFPNLFQDDRNILVADEAMILFEPGDVGMRRVAAMVSALSETVALGDRLRIYLTAEEVCFIHLIRAYGGYVPSRHYDRLSRVANPLGAQVFIGRFPQFIAYRDSAAPRGYDGPPNDDGAGKVLVLTTSGGVHRIAIATLEELPLDAFLARIPARRGPAEAPPEAAFLLAPLALHRLIVRSLATQGIPHRTAQISEGGKHMTLIELVSQAGSQLGPLTRRDALLYLARLPDVSVLRTDYRSGDQRFLVDWEHQAPFTLHNVATAFGPRDWLILRAAPSPNIRLPDGIEMLDSALTDVRTSLPQIARTLPPDDRRRLSLPIRLTRDSVGGQEVTALCLTLEQTGHLRTLLYRLPRESMSSCLVFRGAERTILVGAEEVLRRIPIGEPFYRYGSTALFLPLGQSLLPTVATETVTRVLGLQAHSYTLLTSEWRIDLRKENFAMLDTALAAPTSRRMLEVRFQPPLPQFSWSAPQASQTDIEDTAPRQHLLNRLSSWLGASRGGPSGADDDPDQAVTGRGDDASARPGPSAPPVSTISFIAIPHPDAVANTMDNPQSGGNWLSLAHTCENEGDFLAAAVCYAQAGNDAESASCYRKAAHSLSKPAQD